MGEGPVGFDGVGIFSALWNFVRVRPSSAKTLCGGRHFLKVDGSLTRSSVTDRIGLGMN